MLESFLLMDKSGFGIIVDYSRDYTVVDDVWYFFNFFLSQTAKNYIFQSAKKCELTSLSMTSLHVDLNEAAKCVDITLLASLSRLRTLVQNRKWRRYLA